MAVQAPQGQDGVRSDLRGAREEARELGSEVRGISDDMRSLLKSEVELAKAEMREQIMHAVRGAIFGAIAAVGALMALAFLSVAAIYGLDKAMPLWLAALIVGGVWALLAAIGALLMRAQIRHVTVMPKKTVESLREDVSWAKSQLKSSTT